MSKKNALESYHDAQQALDMAMNLFTGGYLPLDQRCQAENLYWAILVKLKKLVSQMEDVPEDLQGLDEAMADTYFCNFSLFQSMPDSWAIKQLFPVMPIHHLNERRAITPCSATSPAIPTARSTQFIDLPRRQEDAAAAHGERRAVLPGRVPLGAYQEILGDLHNLFGDTNAVHVSLDDQGNAALDAVIKGDTVREVLDYVEFDAEMLVRKLRQDLELAVREGRLTYEESGRLHRLLRRRPAGLHLPRRTQRTLNP